jgi:hypothetical protein
VLYDDSVGVVTCQILVASRKIVGHNMNRDLAVCGQVGDYQEVAASQIAHPREVTRHAYDRETVV